MDQHNPQSVASTLARIEQKVDTLILNDTDKETRLRSLERSKWWMLGAAGAVGYLLDLFRHK